MSIIEIIDETVWGWGLQLNNDDAKKILEHLLWQCENPNQFRYRCSFIFNGPMILLRWEEKERSVAISCDNKRSISASIKPS